MDTKTPRPESPEDEETLRLELDRLRRIISDQDQGTSPDGDASASQLAIFSLTDSLTIQEWNELAARHKLHNWSALPLHGDVAPAIAALQRKIQTLSREAMLDPLTGLANRRKLKQDLELEIERTQRFQLPLSLALVDIDNFKTVNDTYGHTAGDDVLRTLARLLKEEIRRTDTSYRFGGEEFLVMLSGTGLLQAQRMLARFHTRVRELDIELQEAGERIRPTCSIGLACYAGRQKRTAEQIIEAADQAMYQAKEAGKDRLVTVPVIDIDALDSFSGVQQQEKQFLLFGDPTDDPD
jgi:diguanylate cyclase (GGDEF)-like protein